MGAEVWTEFARASLVKIIRGSRGVEAWKDLSYKIGDDGRPVIRGTAYFRDIEKLKIGTERRAGHSTPSGLPAVRTAAWS